MRSISTDSKKIKYLMHFLISAIGSYGDVHPMVGLGEALHARGHRVSVFANPYFIDVVSGAGLELVSIGTADDYSDLTKHPDLWHPRRSLPFVFRNGVIRYVRETYQKMLDLYEPGNTVIAAHGLDAGGRLLGETHRVPVSSVVFSPIGLWSNYHAPKAPGAWTGPNIPRWLNWLQFRIADQLIVNPHLAQPINQFRKELNLAPVNRVLDRWWLQTDQVLCLFPDWFGPPQPDWPPNVELPGFPLWDGGRAEALSAEVRAFLDEGDPPIVFTPGSANRDAARFLVIATQACERLGRRGVLLTKFPEQLPATLPEHVRHFSFVPLSRLLPHSAAFVHHAGIGSCSQGLAAGVPQLVQPMAFDQPDNADRLLRLGVARVLPPRRFNVGNVCAALDAITKDRVVAEGCKALAKRCHEAQALDRACDALEELAATPGSKSLFHAPAN
jgi:UDP:flavonoid glycosyltransferase YjiC (YdhE family)